MTPHDELIRAIHEADDQDRLDDALQRAERAVRDHPGSAEARAARARILFRQSDHIAAEADAQEALRLDPNNASAIRVQAQVLWERDRRQLPKALALLDNALRREPEHYGCLLARAWLMKHGDDLAAAVRDWETAHRIEPKRSIPHYCLGFNLAALDRKDEAVEHLQRLGELRPDDGDIAYSIGTALERLGLPELAIVHLDRGRKLLGPQNAIQLNRAHTLIELKRYQDAIDELNQLLEREPEWDWALHRRARCHQHLGNIEAAEADWKRMLALRRFDEQSRREYGRYLFECGRHMEAVKIDGLMASGDADPWDYFRRGDCRLEANIELDRAVVDFEESIRRGYSGSATAHLYAAICLNRIDRHADALRHASDDATMARYPQEAMRERIRARTGLRDAAAIVSELALYTQDRPDVRAAAADALRELGRTREALEQWALVAQHEPDNAYALWAMGDCLRGLGRNKEAIAWFERAELGYRSKQDTDNAALCRAARDKAQGSRGLLGRLFGS